MSDAVTYIGYDEVLVVYRKTVAASGGGLQGVKNEGRIDKDLLQRIIGCYMSNEDYPESLKLEIIHAIDSRQTDSGSEQ